MTRANYTVKYTFRFKREPLQPAKRRLHCQDPELKANMGRPKAPKGSALKNRVSGCKPNCNSSA